MCGKILVDKNLENRKVIQRKVTSKNSNEIDFCFPLDLFRICKHLYASCNVYSTSNPYLPARVDQTRFQNWVSGFETENRVFVPILVETETENQGF